MPSRSPKKVLTQRMLDAIKPPPWGSGQRAYLMDAELPGFGVAVTDRMDKGHATFILYRRYPGSRNPTRRALGEYPKMTLVAARAKARHWLGLIAKGIDPTDAEERERKRNIETSADTFGKTAEEFIASPGVKGTRKEKEVTRDIRSEFVSLWKDTPIADITQDDVFKALKDIAVRGKSHGRNCYGYLKRTFDYALTAKSHLKSSPLDRIKPKQIFGKKMRRKRTLSDEEMVALWQVVNAMPYPVGHVYKLLMLTGLRLNEVADAKWSELNKKGEWIVPAERMKNKNEDAEPFLVTLSPDIRAVFDSIKKPKKPEGDFIFSHNEGKSPVWISDKVKKRIDEALNGKLGFVAPHWVNHDIRRTIRSGLKKFGIPEDVCEVTIAHQLKGISANYNLHSYKQEKADALAKWTAWLKEQVAAAERTIAVEAKRAA